MMIRIKRLLAVLLLVSMMASFIIPATYADHTDTPETIVYDFKLYQNAAFLEDDTAGIAHDAAAGTYKNFNGYSQKYDGTNRIYNWMFQYYGQKSNWAMESAFAYSTGSMGQNMKNFEFQGAKDQGMRVKWATGADTNRWFAVRIQVPAAGTYTVSVENSYSAVPINDRELYIFPATTQYASNSLMHDPYTANDSVAPENQISTYLTDANKVGTIYTTSQTPACDVGQYTFRTAGDYIAVFFASEVAAGEYIYLSNLTLSASAGEPEETAEATTETTAETTTETTTEETTVPAQPGETDTYTDGVYDFEIYNRQRYQAIFGTASTVAYSKAAAGGNEGIYNAKEPIDTILTREYPAALNWRLEAVDSSMTLANLTFYASANTGLRIQKLESAPISGWAAFRLNVPQAGTFDLNLTTEVSWAKHQIYLFQADTSKMTETEIEAKLTEENLIASASAVSTAQTANKPYTETYTDVEIPEKGEYVIVLKMEESEKKTTIYLSGITLTETAQEEEPSAEPAYVEGIYQFALYENESFAPMFIKDGEYTDLVNTKPCGHCGKTIAACLENQYKTGVLNWVLEDTTFAQLQFMAAGYKTGAAQGMRLRYNAGTTTDGTDNWVAFRIKVNTPGSYTVNVLKSAEYAYDAEMYIFSATEGTMSKEALTAAMTQENFAGMVSLTKAAKACQVNDWTFQNSGEYIIALKNSGTSTRILLDQITLTQPVIELPKEPVDKMLYDFDLEAMDKGFYKLGFFNKYPGGGSVNDQLETLYAQDKLQWKYENKSSTLTASGMFKNNSLYIKSGENFRDVENAWQAFRLESPGAGTYDIRLTSSGKSMAVINVYLIPAPRYKITPQQLQASMTEENRLVKRAIINDEAAFYLGEYTFDTTKEYIMVLEFTKGTVLYLSQIEMTKDGLKTDGTVLTERIVNGTVYNLNLNSALDGIYTNSMSSVADALQDMDAMYASGALNWDYLAASEDMSAGKDAPASTVRFYRSNGLRVPGKKDTWIALKIKSPGNGDFTISLDHSVCGNSGVLAMYVLPGDTDPEKLWEATDPENRVGKVSLSNKTGVVTVEPGKNSFVGYWNFEAGKEYILLFECYENSPFASSKSYMWLEKLIMERGIISYETPAEEKKVTAMTVAQDALPIADACAYGTLMDVNGHTYYFLPVEGKYMLVYDLNTGTLVDKVYDGLPSGGVVGVTKENKVIVAGNRSFVYNPYLEEGYFLDKISATSGLEEVQGVSGFCIDENNILWFGLNYGGYLASYDFETDQYTAYGQPYGYQNRMTGLIRRGDYLYGCIHGDNLNKIFKWDIKQRKIVADYDVTEFMGTATFIQTLNFLGDKYLVAGGSNMTAAVVLNADTFEPVDLGMYAIPNLGVTEEINGKHYMVLQGYGLYEYDVATEVVSKVPGFGTSGIGFRTGGQNAFGKSTVTLNGKFCLFTYTASGGHPRLFNMDAVEYQSWDDMVIHGGGGSPLRTFLSWGEGSNRFSFGGFNTDLCAVYNTQLGQVEFYYKTGGQTDSHIWYDGKLYAGNYSSTTLNEIYPDETMKTLPVTNEVIQRWRLDHEETGQKRVHILSGGDGYVFAGTTPDSNLNGGGICVYDTRTGRWSFHRSPVENGSINGLAYHDQMLFASTSNHGGSGAVPTEGMSSVIFVYDYKTKEVLATLDPRDYIPALASPVSHIYGVTADPNAEENGRMWSIVSDTLFCFTFDKETKTFQVQEVLSFGKSTYTSSSTYGWWPKAILFDMEHSCIYTTFQANGGAQCIEIEDMNAPVGAIKVKRNTRFMADVTESNFYILGDDGNFYYAIAADLKMFPLNLTDEDWAIAQQVDDLILAIGDEITLESEAAVKTARSAYENLSWRYKALIQNLEVLQEAESDVLERKIDTLEGVTMTAEDYPAMQSLMDEYEGLNARQQRYVKNYAALKEKYAAASALNDEKVAAAMQTRINALKDAFPLTLEHEAQVLEIRAEYNALTAKQSVLVDTSILEDAEAQIKSLRVELVAYVEMLIQALPQEITLEAEPGILKAREFADKLYINERKDVSYSKLTSAESKLRTLKNAQAKAEPVIAMINEIGTVWRNDAQRIADARLAYEMLNETERAFVTNYDTLVAAEKRLAFLQTWTVPIIAGGSGVIVLAAALVIFRKKIFGGKKKQNDQMRK